MEKGTTVSYKAIIERVYRDYGFYWDINHYDALEWIANLLNLIGAPNMLEQDYSKITIKEHKGRLPHDLHSIIQVAKLENEELEPMRWATSTFHYQYHCADTDFKCDSSITYLVNNNYIFPSFEEGEVLLAYLKHMTDDEGFPLLPADESVQRAFTLEVALKVAFKKLGQGTISKYFYEKIERDRDWYVAQAVNNSKIQSLSQMESWHNSYVRMIPEMNHYRNFFANFQMPEQMWNQHSDK